jgi:hypothetical protein
MNIENPARVVTVSPESFGAMSRYMDAYRVANLVIKCGDVIKIIGSLLAVVIMVGAFALLSQQQAGGVLIAGALVGGGTVGLVIYVFGTLVAAQGQILLASLDVAVSSSPFLSNEQRAKVMNLAKAEKIRFAMETASHTKMNVNREPTSAL